MGEARQKALAAREAAPFLATASREVRDGALREMARELREHAAEVLDANALDVAAARAAHISEAIVDRLALDMQRVEDMAAGLESLVALPDPLGRTLEQRTLENGLKLSRVSVPLGVVAVIYEARPNVTADAAGICVKSGNAVVLRGGSAAAHSNAAIVHILAAATQRAGLPAGSIELIESTDRAQADELMSLHGIVDVLIPRGGGSLIRHCVECAQVPVIETGTGNCHVYVHASADLAMAHEIVLNAKCRRYGVCNAAETLLVDAAIVDEFLPGMLRALNERGVALHVDARAGTCAAAAGISATPATEHDWEMEYLAPELAVHVVEDEHEAIEHINRYGTRHSEAIVAREEAAIETFCAQVDAAVVYVNASTAFTDGGQFGLGAEIGISTQKLHVRGPFALEALTSYKYIVYGNGQVRA